MPGFLYNVVTQAGAALIAQATAANQIVFVAALSKSTAAASAEELAVQPASWYDGKAGSIAAASATDNVARVVASWQPSGLRQAAKAMCVTARLASQTDAQAVPVIALSDPDSTIELPGADDTSGAVSIPFLADVNATGDVEATPGASASIADLARFVSLHSAGNPTAGDAQTIRGVKSFVDGISVPSGSTLSIAGALNVTGTASFVGIATTGDASVGGTATLASASVTGALSVGGTATLALASVTGDASVGGKLVVTGQAGVIGRFDASSEIYCSSYIIARADGSQVEGSIAFTEKVTNTYIVRGSLKADVASTLPSGTTTGLIISAAHLRPQSAESADLGTSSYRFGAVRARTVDADTVDADLVGMIPRPATGETSGSTHTMAVGEIALVFVKTQTNKQFFAGNNVVPADSSYGITTFAVASHDATDGWVAGNTIQTTGTSSQFAFKFLSQCFASSSTGVVALVMRVRNLTD